MKEIKAYHCDFCKKYSKSLSYIKQHEKICCYNPITKSCATCIHYKQKIYTTTSFLGNRCIDSIPTCDEDVEISNLTEKGKNIQLKKQCPLWEDELFKISIIQ